LKLRLADSQKGSLGNKFNAKFASSNRLLDESEATHTQRLRIRTLGYSNQGVIDALGTRQACCLIEQLEAHPATRMWQRTFKCLWAMAVVLAGFAACRLGQGHFDGFVGGSHLMGFSVFLLGALAVVLGLFWLHR
jgi:hypothetical protein